MQQRSTESINLINHKYNRNNIDVGDSVVVSIGKKYAAIVKGLKLDAKNKKIFAYLRVFNDGLPTRVDISDCKKIKNDI